ncbi:protein zwilch homolog [Tiliqua scincoides]|uniref:protein zwilch homolog n=1 Tax=Tiliqua scincoides TaxID=71010 RepID=UPI00346237C1
MFVVERVRPHEETSYAEEQEIDGTCISGGSLKEDSALLALPLSRARQLISFYTLSQNPNLTHLKISNPAPLPPLWVRCDCSDPQQTIWLGAEPLCSGNKLAGVTLHTITCNGPVSYKNCSADLETLKETHRARHHSSDLTTKGFARYKFLEGTSLESISLEDSLIPLERNIFADFTWNTVTKILQTPLLTSAATLKIQIASGSPLSSVYELNRELQFLLGLAECLKTGQADWPKPLERGPAVELVQKLLRDLKDEVDGVKTLNGHDAKALQDDSTTVCSSMKARFSRRGDLDVVEQLWCKIWRNVASYEDLVKCLMLIMKSLQQGELQTWIHQGSNSLLSRLIKQSYHGSAESVDLSGNTPVQMLLEIGVDKMRRDYVSYFVGKELATPSHLDCFISPSVDLQEQVHCVQKLHHMLEIVANCVELLNLDHENLIFLTRSCVSYYKENPLNERHTFHLPVRSTFVREFCQNAYPQIWRVEIGSGQGQKRVKTTWQLSTSPPATHLNLSSVGPLDNGEACDSKEETCFITLAECSQVAFT